MSYPASTVSADPATREIAIYRVSAPIHDISRHLERAIPEAEPDGTRYRTVHPDTGALAHSQDYTCNGARIELTHARDHDSDQYVADIYIQGDKDRVDSLKKEISRIMDDM